MIAEPQSEDIDIAAPAFAQVRSIPLYEQVKRHVSELILLGTWSPGRQVPSENELARQFAVSVGTVRRALSDLTAEGLLTRRRRTGTVVTGRAPHHSLRHFFQYFRLHDEAGQLIRSEAVTVDCRVRDASPIERQRLSLDDGETSEVVRLLRRRKIDRRVVMWERMVMPALRLPGFPYDDPPERLYVYLLEAQGIRISAVRESLSAQLADDRDREHLRLRGATAILRIEEIAYDQNGAAVIWAVHRALTDTFSYINEIR